MSQSLESASLVSVCYRGRYAYYFEMPYPFDVRRYSKGLIISLGPTYWDEDTIKDWLKWYDKQNILGECKPFAP